MTTPEEATTLIAAFGELIGLPDLAWDSSGRCELDLETRDVGVTIRYDPMRRGVGLTSRLGLDKTPSRRVMGRMLEQNAEDPGGDVLALSPDQGAVLVTRWLDEVADAQTLAATIEALIADTLSWGDQVAARDPGSAANEPRPGARV